MTLPQAITLTALLMLPSTAVAQDPTKCYTVNEALNIMAQNGLDAYVSYVGYDDVIVYLHEQLLPYTFIAVIAGKCVATTGIPIQTLTDGYTLYEKRLEEINGGN